MKKSIFKNWEVAYWVDYSHRKDVEKVVDISKDQYLEETKPVVIEPIIEEPIEEPVVDETIDTEEIVK